MKHQIFENKYINLSNPNEFIEYITQELIDPIKWKASKMMYSGGKKQYVLQIPQSELTNIEIKLWEQI